jgi:methyl-accepting chemotaxis protein
MVLTEPYVDASTHKLVVTFAQALRDGERVAAVVAGDVFMDTVSKNIAAIRPTPGSFGFLVDDAGRLVVHEDVERILKPVDALVPGLDAQRLAGLAGRADMLDSQIDGRARLLVAQPVRGTRWTLVVALDLAEALAGLNSMLWTAAGGSLLVAALTVVIIGAALAAALRRLTALRDVASGDGDLTRRLAATGHDELAEIAHGFNQFVEKMRSTLLDIRRTSDQVRLASQEIATGNADLSARTEQAASSLQQTASSMEQMTGTVGQSADTARQASQLATQAAEAAGRGGQVVDEVVASIADIQDSARQIGDIIGVIDGIAFQTNILALNAAVEAARAGEQGRGFAVVAGEVRSLAQRSAEAAKEIKRLIVASGEKVESGTRRASDAGAAMGEIVASVRRVSDLIGQIAAAAQEQRDGISQVNLAVTQLDQMTQQNAALVEQSAAAASSLKDQAHRLTEAVAMFRTGE